MKKLVLLAVASSIIYNAYPQTPFSGCPNNNIAVVREGNNNDNTNPLSIYNIKSSTGAATFLSGPILDPANATINLQVNGVGLDGKDGFLYALSSGSTTNLTSNIPLPFYRIGADAVAQQIGNMPGPTRAGGETHSFVNTAAGEMDLSDNYYFTGATGIANYTALSFTINRLFIGKIISASSLPMSSTATLNPSYTLITSSDINCTEYLNTLKATFTLANISNAANTGLKDLVYDSVSGNIFTYVTYQDPNNAANYKGMMLKLNPSTGNLTSVSPAVSLSFASSSNEVAGTLLDKSGNFLILFTNGQMYKANTSSPGVFDGSIALLNSGTTLPTLLRGDMTSCGASSQSIPIPFQGCPSLNVALVRAGDNSATSNPISIYDINSTTGAPTFHSGPISDPTDNTNYLQVNGVGLYTGDGFLYGLDANNLANSTSNVAIPFYRIGSNAVSVQLGNMPGPIRVAGETHSFVNPAAGEMDINNNYYFTGATATANFSNLSITVNRLFIGKLSPVSTLPASTSTLLSPSYSAITSSDMNCTDYLNSLKATYTLANIGDATNTGLKDLVYDNFSHSLYSYVTYPNPSNTSQTMGMMVKLDPVSGILTSVAPAVLLSSGSEVAGTLLDKAGNFLILFTDGNIYKANTSSPGVFNGSISILNAATGFPSPLRGDMASCGAGSLLPVVLDYFNAFNQNNTAVLKWETASEINAASFVLEKSSNAITWSAIQTIAARGNSSTAVQYQYTDKDISGLYEYYRLKLVNQDGSFTYSAIKKVSFGTVNNTLACYPNPANNTLYVESNAAFSGNIKVQMNNIIGKTFSPAFKRSDNKLTLDISTLSAGVYFLQIADGNNIRTQKIVKQ
ncbi:MAG: T9SS type A sorting domain-containing protein [Chitinophagaceae bacterium]